MEPQYYHNGGSRTEGEANMGTCRVLPLKKSSSRLESACQNITPLESLHFLTPALLTIIWYAIPLLPGAQALARIIIGIILGTK